MTAQSTTAIAGPTTANAHEELGKFFVIAAMADQAPGMFSRFIDKEWHRFAESADYADFCNRTAGVVVRHDTTCGEDIVTWVGDYHERYGELPAAWFADEAGVVDTAAFDAYRATRIVRASWNCTADTGTDGDFVSPTN